MNEPVTIATVEDKDWIKQIYKESAKELGSFNLFYSWDDFVGGKRGKFIVVRPKAFIRYDWSTKYNSWLIHDVGTLKEFRGQGICRYLIKFVPAPVMLKCNQDNQGGNKFYENIGMKLTGTTETKNGVPQNVWQCVAW